MKVTNFVRPLPSPFQCHASSKIVVRGSNIGRREGALKQFISGFNRVEVKTLYFVLTVVIIPEGEVPLAVFVFYYYFYFIFPGYIM